MRSRGKTTRLSSHSDTDDDNITQRVRKCTAGCLSLFLLFLCFVIVGIQYSFVSLSRRKAKQHGAATTHLQWLTSELEVVSNKISHTRDWITRAKGNLHSTWTANVAEHGDDADEKEEDSSSKQYCGSKTKDHKKNKLLLVLDETDLPGGDISMGPSGSTSMEACCFECSHQQQCIGFTWVLSARQCWLKKSTGQHLSNAGTISGILPGAEAAMHTENEQFERLVRKHKEQGSQQNNTHMLIWPLPKSLSFDGPLRLIAPTFHFVVLTPAFDRIQRAVARYTNKMHSPVTSRTRTRTGTAEIVTSDVPPIMLMNIYCTKCKESELSSSDVSYFDTDASLASYNLILRESGDNVLRADSFSGLIAGLETLTQFCFDGVCNATKVNIEDTAKYRYRGLMVDTGRRFITPAVLRITMELMASLHFNVLHLHLTDWSAVRWDSDISPQLKDGATAEAHRQYTKKEMQELTNFALDRAIVVVPEIDVPGHASSFRPLENEENGNDVEFCSSKRQQLFNDPNRNTLRTLQNLVGEMSSAFDGPIVHVGGDETEEQGSCNKQNIRDLASAMQDHVSGTLNKIPMVWNEVHTVLGGARPETIVQCWNNCNVADIASAGNKVVYSFMHDFYLDFVSRTCTLQGSLHGQCLWTDISTSFYEHSLKPDIKLLIGGEATMWTDEYCPRTKCVGHGEGWGGGVGWMYEANMDKQFATSFLSVIFPRVLLVAGSLWNYDNSRPVVQLIEDYASSASRLERKASNLFLLEMALGESMTNEESITCPPFCKGGCTMLSRCGIQYER